SAKSRQNCLLSATSQRSILPSLWLRSPPERVLAARPQEESSYGSRLARQGTHRRGTGVQSLADPPLRARDASVYRPGLRDEHLQPAAHAATGHHAVDPG